MKLLKLAMILATITTLDAATYVGSQKCQTCHPETYSRWAKTRMANVVRDPKVR